MKTLYESLFDVEDNFDKLDWNKIDILSLFKAKDEADFINMCQILNIRAEKDKKTKMKFPPLINVENYDGRWAVEIGPSRGIGWYNIYWYKGKVHCDKVYGHLSKSCWEMPESLISSYMKLKDMKK